MTCSAGIGKPKTTWKQAGSFRMNACANIDVLGGSYSNPKLSSPSVPKKANSTGWGNMCNIPIWV